VELRYAIVFVSDMERSVGFYRDVLGLPLRFQTPSWTELATEGATLALHAAIPTGAGASAARLTADRSRDNAGCCRPGLSVPDLDAFHRRMLDHGVRCLEEPRSEFGARIALYEDPDGLELSVSEAR
jgi:lactoylglutathione lyase